MKQDSTCFLEMMPYLMFLKKKHNCKLSLAANYGWRFYGIA